MNGISFPQQTTVFGKPPGWKDEDCYGLPVAQTFYRNSEGKAVPSLTSCWQLSKEELEEVNRTGVVWLCITGEGMPPVCIHGFNPIPS